MKPERFEDELGNGITIPWLIGICVVLIALCVLATCTGCGGPPVHLGETGGSATIAHELHEGDEDDLTSIDATAWWEICLTTASGCERVTVGVLYVEGKRSPFGHPDTLELCVRIPAIGIYCRDPRGTPDDWPPPETGDP